MTGVLGVSPKIQYTVWSLVAAIVASEALCHAATTSMPPQRSLPLSFEASQDQADSGTKFVAYGDGYSLLLRDRDVQIRFPREGADSTVQMSLACSRHAQPPAGEKTLAGKVNYFTGRDPSRWRMDIPTYGSVRYRDVYPGIDLLLHGTQNEMEYDFVLAPGADPSRIRLRFNGLNRLSANKEGDLVLGLPSGRTVVHQRPVIYQEIGGVRRAIPGRYVIRGSREVSFRVGEYDGHRPLTIDPVMDLKLSYSSFGFDSYGFSTYYDQYSARNAIAVDSSGALYLGGAPMWTGSACASSVVKIDATGNVVFKSYLAAADSQIDCVYFAPPHPVALAVDQNGNVYVTGSTFSANFPVTAGAFQTNLRALNGSSNPFVLKLGPNGNQLLYSTYFGGSAGDYASGIALDASGNVYITGETYSRDFPTTKGAFQPSFQLTGSLSPGFPGVLLLWQGWFLTGDYPPPGPVTAAFVSKLNPTGTALIYSSYFASPNGVSLIAANAVAVDGLGNAYITGYLDVTARNALPAAPGTIPAQASPAACSTHLSQSWIRQVRTSYTPLTSVGRDWNPARGLQWMALVTRTLPGTPIPQIFRSRPAPSSACMRAEP